jgi:hypothetical protein
MTVDDLREHHACKTDFELSQVLSVSKGTISKWRANGIPEKTQAVLQIKSNDQLKACLQSA